MHYRTATNADAAVLAAMNQQLIRDEGHRNRMTLAELTRRMNGWLAAGIYHAVLFERDGEPVGYALYRVTPEFVYLRQFFVAAAHRRRGIGRAAVAWLTEHAWAGQTRLRCDALADNGPALAFWRAVGFADYCITLERQLRP